MSEKKQTLVSLTEGFVKILMDANGADVDLSIVEKVLKTTKRRLYDVINVLSGVGLVERTGTSRVRWTANKGVSGGDAMRYSAMEREKELDLCLAKVEADLTDLFRSELFQKFGWIDREDANLIEPDQSIALYSLRGPPSMSIIVADEEGKDSDEQKRFICKIDDRRDGQIELNPIRMVRV